MGLTRSSRVPPRLPGAAPVGATPFRPVNVLRRPRAETRSVTLGVLPLAAVFLACALGVVWLQITVTKVGYRLSTMQELVQRLEKERQQLRMEIAAAESPAALEEQGRKLGLGPPAWGKEVVLP